MNNITLPPELIASIGSEKIEFSVKAGRIATLKKSLKDFYVAIAMTSFVVIWAILFVVTLPAGETIDISLSGLVETMSSGNMMVATLIFILLSATALFMLYSTATILLKDGGYFVGTPSRLVQFIDGKTRSMDWEVFSGDIEVSGDDESGNVALKTREGKWSRRQNGQIEMFIPDTVHISDIKEPHKIEEICRLRIKENDRTPAVMHPLLFK